MYELYEQMNNKEFYKSYDKIINNIDTKDVAQSQKSSIYSKYIHKSEINLDKRKINAKLDISSNFNFTIYQNYKDEKTQNKNIQKTIFEKSI